MVGRQSLISKMDQVQILTGVNVQTDTLEIFVKLVGILYLRIEKRVACLYGVIMHDGGMLGEYERSL